MCLGQTWQTDQTFPVQVWAGEDSGAEAGTEVEVWCGAEAGTEVEVWCGAEQCRGEGGP